MMDMTRIMCTYIVDSRVVNDSGSNDSDSNSDYTRADSDYDSDSNIAQKFWFRFWFQFQHHVILILIPLPVFCKFNDSDSILIPVTLIMNSIQSLGFPIMCFNSSINTYYVNDSVFDALCEMFIVQQYIQQAVFHNDNLFTLYGWEDISKIVSLSKKDSIFGGLIWLMPTFSAVQFSFTNKNWWISIRRVRMC